MILPQPYSHLSRKVVRVTLAMFDSCEKLTVLLVAFTVQICSPKRWRKNVFAMYVLSKKCVWDGSRLVVEEV